MSTNTRDYGRSLFSAIAMGAALGASAPEPWGHGVAYSPRSYRNPTVHGTPGAKHRRAKRKAYKLAKRQHRAKK